MTGRILLLLIFLLSAHVVLSQDSLRLLSWNIQMLPSMVRNNGKAKRARAIVDQLKANPYDVVVFQEIFKKRSRRIIRKGIASLYPYHTDVLNKKFIALRTNGGVMLFSRYPITAVHEIRYRSRSGFDKYSRKGALLADIEIKGKTIQVGGTHLQAFGPQEVMFSQYHQLHDELLKRNQRDGVPQFVLGDFNTRQTPTSPPVMSANGGPPLTRYEYMLQTLGAEDGPLAGDQQYTMDRPYNDLCEGNKTSRILLDYILVRPNGASPTVARQVRIIRQQWDKEHRDLSDHFALEGIVSWR